MYSLYINYRVFVEKLDLILIGFRVLSYIATNAVINNTTTNGLVLQPLIFYLLPFIPSLNYSCFSQTNKSFKIINSTLRFVSMLGQME